MTGLLIWLMTGSVVGWLAGLITRGIIINTIVGIVGALIGGLIFARGEINNAPLAIESFAVSLAGAVLLVVVVNFVRRGSIR